MGDPIETQDSNMLPPQRGGVYPLTVDSTARSYDLSTLFGAFRQGENRTVFLTLAPTGNDVYYHFRNDDGAADLSDTAVIAASGGTSSPATLTPNATYAAVLLAGSRADHHISSLKHRYMVVKTASANARLDIFVSSNEAGPP